ncbi:MAG TPA: alkaline phosphatase family protein, partial [Spirochaetia bacterium]|nr:alkaline phosphatase family protein [Spirochaetia bacterium]
PSTTAAALTSLVTGQWPGRHGLTGWYTHLPDHNLTATILPFVDRMTNASLADRGLKMSEIVLEPTVMSELEREVCTILPASLRDGSYSQWAHGSTKIIGYRSLSGGFQSVSANIANRQKPSLTYFYIPDVDTAEHEGGTGGAKVKRIIKTLDTLLLKLTSDLADQGARIIVTADHGLVDVPADRQFRLEQDDRMLDFLEVPPSGEALMPLFHVKAGREKRFSEFFAATYGNLMELLSVSDAEALGLFGPDGISPITRSRLGTFLGISNEPMVLLYDPPGKKPKPIVAFHGGLQPDAIRVPLFIV